MPKSAVAKTLDRALGAKPNAKLLHAADEYKRIKQGISVLEKALGSHKTTLEAAAAKAPNGKLFIGPHTVVLSSQTRSAFDLKEAQSSLGMELLSPFMKESSFTVLRVT